MFASRIAEAKRQGCYVLSDSGTQSYDTRVVSSVADLAPGGVSEHVRANLEGSFEGVVRLYRERGSRRRFSRQIRGRLGGPLLSSK